MVSRIALIVLCLVTVSFGQTAGVSCEIVPQQAAPGTTISFRFTVPTGMPAATLATGCTIQSIRSGMPNGPIVFAPQICPAVLITINPGNQIQTSWNQLSNAGAQVPAGLYWFEIRYGSTATGGSFVSEWFCFEVLGPNPAPSLTSTGPLKVGTLTNFPINAPGHPSQFYIMLPSLTSNNPFMIGSELSCLDMDNVLMAAFPTNTAPSVFLAFAGFLDNSGATPFPAINMPNSPSIAFFPFHMQAVLVDLVTFQTKLTNGLNLIIRP